MRSSSNTVSLLFAGVAVIFMLIVGVIFALPILSSVDDSVVSGTTYESSYTWATELVSLIMNMFPMIIVLVGVALIILAVVFITKAVR